MADGVIGGRGVLPVPPAVPVSPRAVDLRDQSPRFEPLLPVVAPEGAPNVVVILIDDMGFGASSAFGGPCEMPAADRLAAGGLRYSRFHTTGICSPTRGALLTGRNHHSVGFGHISEWASSLPGYNARRPASAATIARVLACNGYATGAFGKMHQTPTREVTPVGPFERWPLGEGFQKFYGFFGGEMNQWQPMLYEGTTPVEQPRSPEEGYHLSEDLVDKAIGWIRDVRTLTPHNRFFCYLPFGATHAPFHVGREWVEKYRGRFDKGWNEQREQILRRQQELGVVPEDAELAPWAASVPLWEDLGEDERRAACALMELYAGFAEHTDAQVGRLVEALAELGVLEDTLIVYILGDNGASAEGGVGDSDGGIGGTVNAFARWNGLPETAANVLAQEQILGSPETYPHYPAGWAVAMDTPYQWMKQVASHYGGTRNGMIVHWPNGIAARNEVRHQWSHVIDIAPTILEAAGLPQPAYVDGFPQMPIEGTAMNYSFDDADAAERHTLQYFEVGGSRGIYHEGWVACTPHRPRPWDANTPTPELRDDVWELYDTRSDWTQAHDLAGEQPEKLEQLQQLFLIEAARHNVLPLDDRALSIRRTETMFERGGDLRSMTLHAGTSRLPQDSVPEVINHSHTITARITVPAEGAEGVICSQGGRFSGWALYCNKGILSYCHTVGAPPLAYVRAGQPLSPGAHELRYEFDYDGGGVGRGGTGALFVDGVKVGEGRIERTVSFVFAVGGGFDVGRQVYTTINDEIRPGDNAFTGEIDWVRLDIGEGVEKDPEEMARIAQAIE